MRSDIIRRIGVIAVDHLCRLAPDVDPDFLSARSNSSSFIARPTRDTNPTCTFLRNSSRIVRFFLGVERAILGSTFRDLSQARTSSFVAVRRFDTRKAGKSRTAAAVKAPRERPIPPHRFSIDQYLFPTRSLFGLAFDGGQFEQGMGDGLEGSGAALVPR